MSVAADGGNVGRSIGAGHVLVVFVLSVLGYVGGLGNGFVWDDHSLIVENDSVKSWSALSDNLTSDFFYFGRSPLLGQKRGYYRPVVTVSYMVDYSFWGLDPRGYHLRNIALHAAATLLLLLVFGRIFPGRPSSAALAAAFFAAHPIHTESVSWISGRTDLLAGLFFFAAFYCYLRARAPGEGGDRATARRIWGAGGVVCFALAILSKESALVLPAALAAYELCLGSPGRAADWRRSVVRTAPYWMVGAVYAVGRLLMSLPPPRNEYVAGFGSYGILLTFVKAIGLYVVKLAVPWPLSAYYQIPLTRDIGQAAVLLPLAGLAGVAVLSWTRRRARGTSSFLVLFFLVSLLPVSNLVPIGAPRDMGFVAAERFLYIPSAAFCALLAAVIGRLPALLRRGDRAQALFGAPLLAVYLGLTIQRTAVWQDDTRFCTETLVQAPDSALLHYLLGLSLWEAGERQRAEAEMREALRCDPVASWAHNNLGNMLLLRGDRPAAMREWEAAVRFDPTNSQAWMNLARALDQSGSSTEAIHAYRAVLGSAPPGAEDYVREAQSRLHALSRLGTKLQQSAAGRAR